MEATKANESIKGAAFIVNETAAQDVFTPEDFSEEQIICLLYTSPSPRDLSTSRMPSSA